MEGLGVASWSAPAESSRERRDCSLRRRALLFVLVAVLLSRAPSPPLAASSFVQGRRPLPPGGGCAPAIGQRLKEQQVRTIARGRKFPRDLRYKNVGVALLRPKPEGFQPSDYPTMDEVRDRKVYPGRQRQNFLDHSTRGYPISEVFMRVPGFTPWKRVGEVVSKTGDFEEALRCQTTIITESFYVLNKKARYWLATDQVIQYGFANEAAEIVPVNSAPLGDAFPPPVLEQMLERSGFLGANKPEEWTPGLQKMKLKRLSRRDAHIHKPWVLPEARRMTYKVKAQYKYNPDKHKGRWMALLGKFKKGQNPGKGALDR